MQKRCLWELRNAIAFVNQDLAGTNLGYVIFRSLIPQVLDAKWWQTVLPSTCRYRLLVQCSGCCTPNAYPTPPMYANTGISDPAELETMRVHLGFKMGRVWSFPIDPPFIFLSRICMNERLVYSTTQELMAVRAELQDVETAILICFVTPRDLAVTRWYHIWFPLGDPVMTQCKIMLPKLTLPHPQCIAYQNRQNKARLYQYTS